MGLKVLIRGGGDLASAVARRLYLSGCQVAVLELEQPRAIRRPVCFASAVYAGEIEIEGVVGKPCTAMNGIPRDYVSVIVDQEAHSIASWQPDVVVDARMLKHAVDDCSIEQAPLVIGLGPGFVAGQHCHAVVETQRGHNLGRVSYVGSAAENTGVPGEVQGYGVERLLRSPCEGILQSENEIGTLVEAGQVVAQVGEQQVAAQITGVLRGLIQPGTHVRAGEKIGDIDPRGIREYCFSISDKANAIAGGVLEAVMNHFNGSKL